ncbi:MAG TPA: hypothetical protein VLB27_05995 [candidate division Zixibacteria bacterium]|nr:hypothetical protein [candidate division Zixibacteria bacterium]
MVSAKNAVRAGLALTIAALITWQMTGGDAYTKYRLNVEVERKLDPSDPLYGTGFYENDIVKETVTRDEFRLGLLPTPQGLFDKHLVSVTTIVGPLWALVGGAVVLARRKRAHSLPRR